MGKSKTKVTISRNAFFSIISEEKRGAFIHIKMKTAPSNILKTSKIDGTINPYYKQVEKITERNFRLLPDYQARVKRERLKKGLNPDTFVAEKATGKTRVKNSAYQSDKDPSVKYIMLEFFEEIKPKVRFQHQGTTIEKAILANWFSDSQPSNEKQGLDEDSVNVITPKLDSIYQATYKGVVYELID